MRSAMLLADQPAPTVGPALAQVLLLTDERRRYLRNLETARIAVEARYLAGHTALFPAELRCWEDARHETDQMIALQARLGELDGWLPTPEPDTTEEVDAAVARLSNDFVEPAKVHALEKVDEGRLAFATATRWLRPRLRGPLEPTR